MQLTFRDGRTRIGCDLEDSLQFTERGGSPMNKCFREAAQLTKKKLQVCFVVRRPSRKKDSRP